MTFSIPYGSDLVRVDMGWGRYLGTLDIAEAPAIGNLDLAVREALEHPIGQDKVVFETVQPGETVAIVVSDSFRHTGADKFLPVLIDGLNGAGIPDKDIRVVYATGTHRPPTRKEEERILGSGIYRRFQGRAGVHDAYDESSHEYVGTTSRGTPVEIDKRVLACDRVISTGAVVLHYHAGYGGGRKSIVPGIASAETTSRNHSLNLHPRENRLDPAVRIGALEGNPVAEDMIEAARFVTVDCLLNTVINRKGQIAGLFAGDIDAAHRAAAAFAYDVFAVSITERADLVIASSGDLLNFVQSHKALFNSYQAVKPDGRLVLLTRCPEGLGGEQYVKWLRLGDRDTIIAGLRKQCEINGQTALSTLQKTPITVMVTDLSEGDVALMGARKASSAADALALAREELRGAGRHQPTYYVMPSAAYTVPFLRGKLEDKELAFEEEIERTEEVLAGA